MSFAATERIIAIAPENIEALFAALLATYGEVIADGNREVVTIGAFWDDTERTIKRAAEHPTTITGVLLTNGRMAYRCLWQTDLMAEFDLNGLAGVEELTPEQFAALLPEEEL